MAMGRQAVAASGRIGAGSLAGVTCTFRSWSVVLFSLLLMPATFSIAEPATEKPLKLSDLPQLFLDDYLVSNSDNLKRKLLVQPSISATLSSYRIYPGKSG